jgi:pyruvate dehydrogenase E1 component beta subunit
MLGNVPGLRLLMPAAPGDAYHLLKWALTENRDPAVFMPHAMLLEVEEDVDFSSPPAPFGSARVARAGTDVTIVAHSVMVRRALEAAEELSRQHGIDAEVLDMRTLSPLDRESLVRSVARTGRAVVADECHFSFGAGAELAATLAQDAFAHLKAPVRRVATPDVPIPYSPSLESALVVTAQRIAACVLALPGLGKNRELHP